MGSTLTGASSTATLGPRPCMHGHMAHGHVNLEQPAICVRLMGQSITLLDFDFGDTSLNWPEPIKTVTRYGLEPIKGPVTERGAEGEGGRFGSISKALEAVVNIGREVVSCATEGSVTDVFKCFGNKLLEVAPRLKRVLLRHRHPKRPKDCQRFRH